VIQPIIIEKNKALKLRANFNCVDCYGKNRSAGEEWLVRKQGSYLLGINEILVEVVNAVILTNFKALHLAATKTFVDFYGKERKAGEEWLVTKEMTSTHIYDVYERLVNEVNPIVLNVNEYCYVLNPVEDGVNKMGKKVLVKGPKAFFLNPGEILEGSTRSNYILGDDQGLLLKAQEVFVDEEAGEKSPGDVWMIAGPYNYVPPVEVTIIENRTAIPLDTVEGIYVRNINTGAVNAITSQTYMLKANEQLANKKLPDVVDELLQKQGGVRNRELYSVVTFRVPYNTVVQIYDYKAKVSRVVFGPDLIMLNPDEEFTVSYLSGSTPKVPGRVKTLSVSLGPNFTTDKIMQVETSDHARLELMLSYNWKFKVDNPETDGHKIFNVRDFVGDMCSSMASRVRAAVASMPFDQFHKSSVYTIRRAIFGVDPKTGHIIEKLENEINNLVIFNVDVQMAEAMDKKTKESLQKTVTQAIEITSKIQEQQARRRANKVEQKEKAKLDRLILEDNAKVEEAKKQLLKYKAESAGIKSKGQAIAESKAKAEAAKISAEADVAYANLQAQARKIKELADIEHDKAMKALELDHKKQLSEQDVRKAKDLANIESSKFKSIMEAIGQSTLVDIAKAGPETQGKMLESLGLKGYMIMDSKNPINLFTTANGMILPEGHEE
jgi:major vault protein